jgi:hypothetical protein
MDDTTQVILPDNCGFSCQFEWIEVASNFFNVSVYTPALIAGLAGYLVYRFVKKSKKRSPFEKK